MAYNDGRESSLRDPVQGGGQLVQSQNDKGSSEEKVEGRADVALRVDCSAGHGSSGRHGTKETVDDVLDAEEDQLLTLVDLVVVPQAERLADAQMLDGHGNEGSKGTGDDLLQQRRSGGLRGKQAMSVNHCDAPPVIVGLAAGVDEVGDESEEDEDDDGAAGAEDLDPYALLTPFLADFFEDDEEEDAEEANHEGHRADLVQVAKDSADGLGGAAGYAHADEGIDLAEQDDEGHGRDPARQDGGRDEVEQESELQEAHGQ